MTCSPAGPPIRSMHNRMLTDGTPLAACCAGWQEQRRYTIDVPVRGTQPARQATVRLRFGTVSLRRPGSVAADRAAALSLSVVDVKEVGPPAGQEPVQWRLLTTHLVSSVEQARQIVAWYRRRWTIDIDQAWRLSRIKGWMGSICNEAFWVAHCGPVFSPVRIRAADRQAIADQQGRAVPARRRGIRRVRCRQDWRAGCRAIPDIGRGSPRAC